MKILLIRFSSFGDVLQSLSVVGALKREFPASEVHWATRDEFVELIVDHPGVDRVWSIKKSEGLSGLWRLASHLKRERYQIIYDAHNNLRSRFLSWVLLGLGGWRRWLGQVRFVRRPIYRWRRFLLFNFRINKFEGPFNGQRDLLSPLKTLGVSSEAPPAPQLFIREDIQNRVDRVLREKGVGPFVALAPSAAYPLKRWPRDHWEKLIDLYPGQTFVLLGGPSDTFLEEMAQSSNGRVINLAGQLSYIESGGVVKRARLLVSNDTGTMHLAEQLGIPCVALMGPAPFGFPSRPSTRIMELNLPCRPCSKHGQGPCRNKIFQECLTGISPEAVKSQIENLRGKDNEWDGSSTSYNW